VKAVTVTQPHSTLIAILAKKFETRNWSTSYRGPLAIHAGKGFPDENQRLCMLEPFRSVLKAQTKISIIWDRVRKESDFPLGAIIATSQLVNVVPVEVFKENRGCVYWIGDNGKEYFYRLTEQERAFGDYSDGRFAWILDEVKPLAQPIPVRGFQRLWEWEAPALVGMG
jgi:activating signal cointegrator 1